ncbi:MAG: glycosyltransferase family 39 protein, partial [Thermoplasmata archaeon]|nr:glycosyltransferase family 39 protein [Thermoplasmata archaeon]
MQEDTSQHSSRCQFLPGGGQIKGPDSCIRKGFAGLRKRIATLIDLDWTSCPNLLILIALFTISRVILLNTGFGLDADAWRIANTAHDLNNLQVYHTSRSFGFPLPEIIDSLVINYEWVATNSLTMVLSLVSVIFFAKILNEWNVENKGIIVVAYCFMPILWINSANSMDYMWALTFIILSWFSVLKDKYLLAGVMLGLAIGSRMTSAVFVLPLLYLISERTSIVKDSMRLVLGMMLTSFVLFLPVFLQYGTEFLSGDAVGTDLVRSILIAGKHLGILSVVLILAVLVSSGKKLIQNLRSKDRITVFLSLSICLFLIVYFIAPYEVGYLIPVIPFGLLLLGKIGG